MPSRAACGMRLGVLSTLGPSSCFERPRRLRAGSAGGWSDELSLSIGQGTMVLPLGLGRAFRGQAGEHTERASEAERHTRASMSVYGAEGVMRGCEGDEGAQRGVPCAGMPRSIAKDSAAMRAEVSVAMARERTRIHT